MVSVFGTVLNGANWLFLTMGLWLTKLAASPSWDTDHISADGARDCGVHLFLSPHFR